MNVVGYIRMSTGFQENSPENQRSAITDYCKRKGYTIIKFYEDLAISGGSMDKRSSLIEMILEAEKKHFDGIVFYKYDRAFRNLEEQLTVLTRLKHKGVKFFAVADPEGDGASGELITNILGAVNQFERQLTGERIYHNNREKARKGFWTGSNGAPFGYDYNKVTKALTINEEEAAVVRRVFELYLHHRSANRAASIIRHIAKTKKGNLWTLDRVVQMIANPVYVGMIRWGHRRPVPGKNWHKRTDDYEVFPGRHEAIIDEATFAKAQEIVRENANTKAKPGTPHLLGGLLRCGLCQGRVTAGRDRAGVSYYRCQERYYTHVCEGWSRTEGKLLIPILDAISQNIQAVNPTDIDMLPEIDEAPHFDDSRQLKQVEKKIAKLYFAFEGDQVDEGFFIQRNTELQKEKERLTRSVYKVANNTLTKSEIAHLTGWRSQWESADYAGKKALLAALIEKVHVDGDNMEIRFIDFGLPNWQTIVNTRVLQT